MDDLSTTVDAVEMTDTRTVDIIRTFTSAAVSTGALTQRELDEALDRLTKGEAAARDQLITYREAANQLGISTKTVKRMTDSGELQSRRLRVGCAKSVRIFQSSVDAILTPDQSVA
ncbi:MULTISPECIES: helix-turn-helix domain-containing protein [unclassified Lentimonas]|uniref:helix-turn-helix domain-containing protein n=1 Tax=unclassified Lentimonas TaxID=2630993 RepID=UPI001326DC4D|nr:MULTISPECIES: helix-turn-helix domain-containing protein [unclassified Lentimonas]CAA6693016.1 Unannotated [Lentimonas sp. CC10]CAA6695715.1 Unannotated [Lentimonas sp. CC19]CAA7070006.1 Unannotated [Lentimonas sp. CC11]